MNQELRYKGLSMTPDELAAENGSLALCANAELCDGALRPSVVSGTDLEHSLTYTQGNVTKVCTLLYVHKTSAYTHLIAVCPPFEEGTPPSLRWFKEDGTHGGEIEGFVFTDFDMDWEPVVHYANIYDVEQVESIGNTLVVLCGNGKHYAVWKDTGNNGGEYKYLGLRPPFVELSFALFKEATQEYDRSTVGGERYSSAIAYRRTSIQATDDYFENTGNSEDNTGRNTGRFKVDLVASDITREAWALINQTHDFITRNGQFYTNFLVRYCYRLFDGSMFVHSAPVFMPVGFPNSVQVLFTNNGVFAYSSKREFIENGHYTVSDDKMLLAYRPTPSYLYFKCDNPAAYATLKEDWGDVVTSIDVFVSPQFLKVEDSGVAGTASEWKKVYGIYLAGQNNVPTTSVDNGVSVLSKLDLKEISDDEYFRKIRDNSTFYKIKSFFLGSTAFPDNMPYEHLHLVDVLPVLTSQEKMEDDYKSHNVVMPTFDKDGKPLTRMYLYNSRLHLSAVSEVLFRGHKIPGGIAPACEADTVLGTVTVDSLYYTIDTAEGKKVVMAPWPSSPVSVFSLLRCLFFYPDSRASMATLNYTKNGTQYHVDIPMEACLNLNGSMAKYDALWSKLGLPVEQRNEGTTTLTISNVENRPNVIYTSDAGNPFRFPPNSIYTVGTGTILGMAATTRAISQGQFGAYPLMAFATDGVYALDVTSTGTYGNIHPISREVCSNPGAICQIDQQVVLATTRGLSVVTEQDVSPITDMLDGIARGMDTIAPGLKNYFEQTVNSAINALLAFNDEGVSPADFFQEARVVYDFACNRLLVFKAPTQAQLSAGVQPMYVYSIRAGAWSTMAATPITAAVNGYPHPYLQHADGSVTVLDKPYPFGSDTTVPTLFVTRALHYGDAMHVFQDLAHNKLSHSRPVLFVFGSNDLLSWHYVGRTNQRQVSLLPGHAWRFFRLAVYHPMTPGECYISTSFNIAEKYPKLHNS